jgi:PAS domain S-box-containing protein
MNLDITTILHPDDHVHVFSEIAESLQKPGESIHVTPARMKHKQGSWRWFGGTITNMLHDPAIAGIVDNFKDITEEVEAKQKLQSFINSINGIFFEATPDGVHFNYVSPQVEDILGYKPQEWLETRNFWSRHIHPDDRQRSVMYCRQQTELGKDHSFDYRFKKADGTYIWLRDLISVITEGGKPIALQGLMLDITEEKKLEAQLEIVYKSARIGDWEIDFRKNSLTWSRYVKELHEVPLSYKPTLEAAINFYEAGEHREKISQIIADLRQSGFRATPIVIVSGHALESRGAAGPEASLHDAFIAKPYNLSDLLERLAQLMRLSLVYAQNVPRSGLQAPPGRMPAPALRELCDMASLGNATALRRRLAELAADSAGPDPRVAELSSLLDTYDLPAMDRKLRIWMQESSASQA